MDGEKTYHVNRRHAALYISDAIIIIAGLICISTLLTEVNPFSSSFNRLLIVLYICISLMLISKISRKTAVLVAITGILVGVDVFITDFPFKSLNDVFYLPVWVINLAVYTTCLEKMKQSLVRMRGYLNSIVCIWSILVIASFFYDGSFRLFDGVKSFVSFCGTEHRFAATALFIVVILLFQYKITHRKKYILLVILPFVTILLTNTRTYIIMLLFLSLYFVLRFVKSTSLRYTLFLIGVIVFVYAVIYYTQVKFTQSSVAYQLKKHDMLYVITSGRNEFWAIDLMHFFQSPLINVLWGRGYNFVYETNLQYYGTAIWAHNDYINVLCANGLIGLYLYLASFFLFVKKCFNSTYVKKSYLTLYIMIIVCDAMFNMIYTYTIASIATPLIAIAMLLFDE